MRKTLLVLILIVLGLSCNRSTFFCEKYTFEDYRWSKDEEVIFSPQIPKDLVGKKLQAVLNIRYVAGFYYRYLNFNLIITNQDGLQMSEEISIQVINENKEYIGSGMGDIWDLDYELPNPLIFKNEGTYKIEFKPILDNQPYNFINELGISLKYIAN
jgi:gliding motility-associated lipoprotein GldH